MGNSPVRFLRRITVYPSGRDVVLNQSGDRFAELHQVFGIGKHVDISAVPGDEVLFMVDHADALLNILQHRLKHMPVKSFSLRVLIENG